MQSLSEKKSLHIPSRADALPKHWRWERLDEICDGVFDCPHSTPVLTNDGPFVVRSQDVRSGIFRMEEAGRVSDETYQERIARAEPRHGDLVYSREGTYFGIAAELPPGVRVCLGQRMVLLRPSEHKANFRFLRYWLNSPVMARHIQGQRDGTVAERLNMPTIRALPVALPPLSEQRAVAAVLGALDDKIELNRRMNETLEAMARALFQNWFVDATQAGLPKGWRVGVLSELAADVVGGDWGADQPAEEEAQPAFCIRGADIPDLQKYGVWKMPIRYLKPSSLEKRRLRDGDLAVEISGGSPTQSTGRPVLVSDSLLHRLEHPLVCSNFCRVLKLKSRNASKFVYLWLRWLYANDEFLQFENGTTGIKNFAFTLFSQKFELAIPPSETLDAFNKRVSPLFEKQQVNGAESATLAALRDALLPKLLSGELRVPAVLERMSAKS